MISLASEACTRTQTYSRPKIGFAVVIILAFACTASALFAPVERAAAAEALAAQSGGSVCSINDRQISTELAGNLEKDHALLCFEGIIDHESIATLLASSEPIEALKISSSGGDVEATIMLARKLHDDGTHVIVEDRCLSSCANYIVSGARHLYVSRTASIAIHGGPPRNFVSYSAILSPDAQTEQNEAPDARKYWEDYKSGALRAHIDYFDYIDINSWFVECFSPASINARALHEKKLKWLVVDYAYALRFLSNVRYWDDPGYKDRNERRFTKYAGKDAFVWGGEVLEIC